MNSIIATMLNEFLHLRRDRTGLAVIFLMPVLLVIIMTLVQNNVLTQDGTEIEVLLVNEDTGEVGTHIENWLSSGNNNFSVFKQLDNRTVTKQMALDAVNNGDYQLGIFIPENLTGKLMVSINERMGKSFKGEAFPNSSSVLSEDRGAKNEIILFFDPVTQGSLRSAIESGIKLALLSIEFKLIMDILPENFNRHAHAIQSGIKSRNLSDDMVKPYLPEEDHGTGLNFDWNDDRFIAVNTEKIASPTAVQQNVPAWALFGMFFIVIPLGGTLLMERDNGTLNRLLLTPSPKINLLLGKIFAYMAVCLFQFFIMICVGLYILPVLGTPALELGKSRPALLVMAISSSLAAVGYGILIGTLAKSYRQAAVFGPLSVVIASAIGGIMVPVYVMPDLLKKISIASPLAWGLNGFLDIFVRNGNIPDVLPWVLCLILFFASCLIIAGYSLKNYLS